ncbi:gamma-glutamyl-gamma-aminobutyrate hydrolase family protein [Rhodococcus sp. ABRD24]|uniref:gamma-glutamyl-gamma-aminobutyrate hydrolase family protein n=1 Tax=Rhodococcus sp. ABRD24 TaxID=2507582 RepID=UPI0010397513|nr:gamma-glutamyl-gamma-aminobutyrate hydrolase family protein [Rhodococcus sp. ABRD24]QBJ95249.1 gamma-glutamyl-gamma-aminobutyrate hydrolase family protein [Rhodococcus sp. ABRD24]
MGDRPTIAVTTWRRDLPTYLGENTDLFTVGTEYVRFFSSLGMSVILIPECTGDDAASLLSHVSGLVLSGGEDVGDWIARGEDACAPPDATSRDTTEHALVAAARDLRLPVFGICRGMQLLAALHGSRVVDLPEGRALHPYGLDAAAQLDCRHEIELRPTASASLGDERPRRMRVNSIHQQVISHCPEGFAVTAVAADGSIEAIESTTDWYAAGVQWHPEKMNGPGEFGEQKPFVSRFVEAVENYCPTPDSTRPTVARTERGKP